MYVEHLYNMYIFTHYCSSSNVIGGRDLGGGLPGVTIPWPNTDKL